MVIHVRHSKIMATGFLLVLFAFILTAFLKQNRLHDSAGTAMAAFEEQDIKDQLLVYLFLDNLQEQSDLFYEPYYTLNPEIVYYLTTLKEVTSDGPYTCIKFVTLPYLGPHDTIGEDEISFCINHSGEVVSTEFRHLNSYTLPDYLRSLEKGALPPTSQ